MKIITYNVNGIRAAIKKGFLDWLKTHPADVICIQENKAQETDIKRDLIEEAGYSAYWFCAKKKGYSGVTVFSKIKPDEVKCGTGHEVSDDEGRVLQLRFGKVLLINAYFPSGTMGEVRQAYKYKWLDEFYAYVQELKQTNPYIILCGDYNIAHKETDIHDPVRNKNTTGFLPPERAWMDKLYSNGWVDVLREFKTGPGYYTWWSQRFPSLRADNRGWRIDYISVTDNLKAYLADADIQPMVQHSDHCPVYAEINIENLGK